MITYSEEAKTILEEVSIERIQRVFDVVSFHNEKTKADLIKTVLIYIENNSLTENPYVHIEEDKEEGTIAFVYKPNIHSGLSTKHILKIENDIPEQLLPEFK